MAVFLLLTLFLSAQDISSISTIFFCFSALVLAFGTVGRDAFEENEDNQEEQTDGGNDFHYPPETTTITAIIAVLHSYGKHSKVGLAGFHVVCFSPTISRDQLF